MPLWDFHLGSGILSANDKAQLSKSITNLYTNVGMPAFYVQVRFTEGASTTYVGGDSAAGSKLVCIQIQHVARNMPSTEQRERFLNATDVVLKRALANRGLHWEYWVLEGPRDLWKYDSIVPPPTGSEMEKRWAEANAPIFDSSLEKL